MFSQSDSLPTSHTLLFAAFSGNSLAWEKLVDVYASWIIHCCRMHGFKEAEALDISQNVFLSLFKHQNKFQITRTPGSFRKWLSVCAFHEAVKVWEFNKTNGVAMGGSNFAVLIAEIPNCQTEQSESAVNFLNDKNNLLKRVLQILETEFSVTHYLAFKRHIIDGQNAADVASELVLKKSNVRTICSRMMARIRDIIDDE